MENRLIDYCYIFATIFFTLYGQLIIKWRISQLESFPPYFLDKLKHSLYLVFDPIIFTGIFAAFLASIAWISAMSRFEISYAYPFVALNFLLVIILGALIFNESLTFFKIIGVMFIAIGIIFTSKS